MARKIDENRRPKTAYEKPTATIPTSEQAKLKLMGHAMIQRRRSKETARTSIPGRNQEKPNERAPSHERYTKRKENGLTSRSVSAQFTAVLV